MYHQDTDYKNTNALIRNTIYYSTFSPAFVLAELKTPLERSPPNLVSFFLSMARLHLNIYTNRNKPK